MRSFQKLGLIISPRLVSVICQGWIRHCFHHCLTETSVLKDQPLFWGRKLDRFTWGEANQLKALPACAACAQVAVQMRKCWLVMLHIYDIWQSRYRWQFAIAHLPQNVRFPKTLLRGWERPYQVTCGNAASSDPSINSDTSLLCHQPPVLSSSQLGRRWSLGDLLSGWSGRLRSPDWISTTHFASQLGGFLQLEQQNASLPIHFLMFVERNKVKKSSPFERPSIKYTP